MSRYWQVLIEGGVAIEFEGEDQGILWCKKAKGNVEELYKEMYDLRPAQ